MRTSRVFRILLLLAIALGLWAPALWAQEQAFSLSEDTLATFRATLEANLSSEQGEVRRLAVLSLGALLATNDEVKAFKAYTKDVDPTIRYAAWVVLALRKDKEAEPAILKELASAEADRVDRAVAELITPLPPATQASLIDKALKKAPPPLQQALYAYVISAQQPAFATLITAIANIKEPEQRTALIELCIKNPPPEALTLAQRLMAAKEAPQRLEGLRLANAIANYEALNLIAKGLDDSTPEVQNLAESLLEAQRHPALAPLLERRIQENPNDFESMKRLMRYDPPNLYAVLLPVVQRENPSIALADYKATMALIAAAQNAEAHRLISDKLASSYESDRVAATHALGFANHPEGNTRLERLINDGSIEVRRAAAESLGRLGSPSATPILAKALTTESDAQTLLRIVAAFGQTNDPEAVNHLQLLMIHNDKQVRRAAMVALGQLRAIQAASAIEIGAQDPDPEMRWVGAFALFNIDPTVYGERMRRLVGEVPEEAFFTTLEEIGPEMAIRLEDEAVRSNRGSITGRLLTRYATPPRNLERVRFVFDHGGDRDTRMRAMEILAETPHPEDVQRFVKVLDDERDRRVRLIALRAILRLEKGLVHNTLLTQSDSDDPLFKAMAIYGLLKP